MKYASINDVVRDLEKNPVENNGNIYHPIPFPEFSHLKTSSNEKVAQEKLYLINNVLEHLFPDNLKGKKLLDIGANAGLYTFSFAQKGMSVTAFEPHTRYAPIGVFLAKEKKLHITWHNVPFDKTIVPNQKFDFAIMMSVFQWMAEGDNNHKEAAYQLKHIADVSSYLIFEMGFNTGKSCIKTNKINHYSALITFLQDNTSYKNFKFIGKTNAWGKSGTRFMVLCSNDKDLDDSPLRKLMRSAKI